MNSLERVFAAVKGEPTDRRAFSLVLSLYGARLTECPLDAYYSQPEKYLAGQRAVVKLCDSDILFTPFILPLEARAFGCELVHLAGTLPTVKKPASKGLGDLAPLLDPDPAQDQGFRYLVESTRLLASEFGGDKPIAAILTAPTDLPALLVGIGEWLEALLFAPEARAELIRRTTAHFVRMADAMLKAGAVCVVVPAEFVNPRLITAKIAQEVMIPLLADAFSQLSCPIIIHNGGNKLSDYLHLFKNLPNVVGFVLDQRDSFASARGVLGDNPVLFGNLSGPHLPGFSPEQAYARTRGILTDRAADPRFVFCTSNADVPWSTPPETIEAVARAVLDEGGERP